MGILKSSCWIALATLFLLTPTRAQDPLPVIPVEGQPLAANVRRALEALRQMGQPLAAETASPIEAAARERDHARLQTLLDPHVLLVVAINPESRVKVSRGPAKAVLQQGGYTPVLVKIIKIGRASCRERV